MQTVFSSNVNIFVALYNKYYVSKSSENSFSKVFRFLKFTFNTAMWRRSHRDSTAEDNGLKELYAIIPLSSGTRRYIMLYGVQFGYMQWNSQEKISEINMYLKQSKDLRLNAKGSNETEDELLELIFNY